MPITLRIAAKLALVITLVVWVTPGLIEAGENLWHLVSEGHTAHSPDAGEDHQPSSDEHGCTGSFHLCSCHRSPPSQTEPIAALADAATHGDHRRGRNRALEDDLLDRGLDHVPRLLVVR